MNSFFSISKKNFKNNPKKIFFYDLKSQFTGYECYKYLNKIVFFLKRNDIKSIGICCKNNINWPLWYLASIQICKDVFILNPNYIINRYFNHPNYKYKIYILRDNQKYLCSLLVVRKIRFKNSSLLRLVDYQGNKNFLSRIYTPLQELLKAEKSEYIDFYQHGLAEKIFKNSGFINTEETNFIVPNYFEPFVRKKIKLNFAYKSSVKNKKIYFFKGDGDQDRPNRV